MNRNYLKNNENGIIYHCEASVAKISCKHHHGQCAMLKFYSLVVHARGYNLTLFGDFFFFNELNTSPKSMRTLSQCL